MTVGERIKQKRIDLGLSQDELAKKVGYKSRSSIQKIECARDLPLNKVDKMAKALDCSPSYLMGWEDEAGERNIYGQYVDHVQRQLFPDDASNPEADHLFELYQEAPPEIQAAIDTLLGYKKPDA